jgi:hypothetical protein
MENLMRWGISLVLAVVVVPGMALTADVASAQGHYYGTPHSIEIKFEPAYVNVGDTVKVIATFAPRVDIESVLVSVTLPLEARVDSSGGVIREWREKVRKDEAIALSGSAVFPEPGLYKVQVSYSHPDPDRRASRRVGVSDFHFVVPGGVPTARPEDDVPVRMDAARLGARGALVRRESVRSPVQTGMGPARDSIAVRCQGGVDAGTAAVARITLLDARDSLCADTTNVTVGCYNFFLVKRGDAGIDLGNWRVVPPSLGSVVGSSHSARFTAGSLTGVGEIRADAGDVTYVFPIKVIVSNER